MVIVKCQAIWTGFQGAPGYTNWYGLSDGDSAAAANALGPRMRTFFSAMSVGLPTGSTVKVQRAYQVLEATNGRVTSEGNLSADPAAVTGAATGNYSVVTGCCVNWNTGLYNAKGHRITGRTFLVPLMNIFDTNGTISDASLTIVSNAATAAVGGLGNLVVYTRPSAPGASDGNASTVVSARVPDKAVVLRSRRD
jgi:hypothetical protein